MRWQEIASDKTAHKNALIVTPATIASSVATATPSTSTTPATTVTSLDWLYHIAETTGNEMQLRALCCMDDVSLSSHNLL